MKFCFETKELVDIYRSGSQKYPKEIVVAFTKRVNIIRRVKDERELRAIKGNHFEKLKGYQNLYSIMLNDKYRMEFSIDKESDKKVITIKRISNHYS